MHKHPTLDLISQNPALISHLKCVVYDFKAAANFFKIYGMESMPTLARAKELVAVYKTAMLFCFSGMAFVAIAAVFAELNVNLFGFRADFSNTFWIFNAWFLLISFVSFFLVSITQYFKLKAIGRYITPLKDALIYQNFKTKTEFGWYSVPCIDSIKLALEKSESAVAFYDQIVNIKEQPLTYGDALSILALREFEANSYMNCQRLIERATELDSGKY